MITPQPGILDIKLYESGESNAPGLKTVVKLSSNENPFGPPPLAVKAVCDVAQNMNIYPPSDHQDLRTAIGSYYGLNPDQIICGAGSDEIISFLCQAYAGPGDEVIYTQHGFAMYRISALAAGATPIEVTENNRVTDIDAILRACTRQTRLVFIANPNNPTGTMICARDIGYLADHLPRHVLLVVDGAYAEYVDGYDGGASLVETRDNIVMTRTFSKLYGLGGVRVGWGYGPRSIIDVLGRLRGPFNVSQMALVAAGAALKDKDFIAHSLAHNARMRDWLQGALINLGIGCDPSLANFVLARFSSQDEADEVYSALKSHGFLVRKVARYQLPECLRITVGRQEDCENLIGIIAQFKESGK